MLTVEASGDGSVRMAGVGVDLTLSRMDALTLSRDLTRAVTEAQLVASKLIGIGPDRPDDPKPLGSALPSLMDELAEDRAAIREEE